jgi:hypothetical protein
LSTTSRSASPPVISESFAQPRDPLVPAFDKSGHDFRVCGGGLALRATLLTTPSASIIYISRQAPMCAPYSP